MKQLWSPFISGVLIGAIVFLLFSQITVCHPVKIGQTVIGKSCSPLFEPRNVKYKIKPEYNLAFILSQLDLGVNIPRSSLFNKPLVPQRDPGTDQLYEYIPPHIDPIFEKRPL